MRLPGGIRTTLVLALLVIVGGALGGAYLMVVPSLERRLVGPIWLDGRLVTDTWLGEADDPPAESHDDVVRAVMLVGATGVIAALLSCAAL